MPSPTKSPAASPIVFAFESNDVMSVTLKSLLSFPSLSRTGLITFIQLVL